MELAISITDPRFLEELPSLNRGDVYFEDNLHLILNVPDPKLYLNQFEAPA